MFRTAELGKQVPKVEYHEAVPILREGLLDVQLQLRAASFPLIIVFGGVDKGGKIETINLLNEWLDPRWMVTHAYGMPSDEEIERPEFWRYWRDLPPNGKIGFFVRSWYSRPVMDRVQGRTNEVELDEQLDRVLAFENCLADDGALILKFWMHLGRKQQKERLEKLEKNPLTRWRVTQTDWDHWQKYDEFVAAAERVIMRTSVGNAPWHIVEGYDKRYRSLTVGKLILEATRKHLEERELHDKVMTELRARERQRGQAAANGPVEGESGDELAKIPLPRITILDRLDMTKALDKKTFDNKLEELQGLLNQKSRDAKQLGVSTILVFEGWDAAGKGGAIRRIIAALDARDYQVIPTAAPTDEERAHHYLWRFWRHLSRAGRITIYDRSWYGRVLVERVEGFAVEAEWRRAYAEINDFEEQIVQHGIVLCKFWLHITPDEQLKRFKERETLPYKRWKLTDEDWRNREKWPAYEFAVNDMVAHTSTQRAPWTLVEASDKRFARIKIMETICKRLTAGIERAERASALVTQFKKVGRK